LKADYKEDEDSLVGKVLSAHKGAPWLRSGGFQSGCMVFGCELAYSIVIDPEGKIGNCPYMNYSGPRNVREGDFAKMVVEDCEWHHNAMKASKKCSNCDLRNFQCGGCKIFGNCTEQLKLRNYYRMLEEKLS
jgi:radical SAM protein with 4Fe4S-binding SPASM domain